MVDDATTPLSLAHYTDLDGLIGIVKSRELWASNASFLNDRRELVHGIEASVVAVEKLASKAYQAWRGVLENVVRDLEQGKMPDTYVVCFSRMEDSLSQWRAYAGNEQGVAVVFDVKRLCAFLFPHEARLMRVIYGTLTAGRKMRDELKREIDLIDELDELTGQATTNDRKRAAFSALSWLIPRFKHFGFADEREWRFVVQVDGNSTDVEFRRKSAHLLPYIKLGSSERLPIKRVVVGPGKDPELTRKSLEGFLKSEGYSKIRVAVSKVPFRT